MFNGARVWFRGVDALNSFGVGSYKKYFLFAL